MWVEKRILFSPLADESHDETGRERKGYMVEAKTRIAFAKVVYLKQVAQIELPLR
jgi:hypothetical protein